MIAEYIDGGLEPRQRADVEAHLAGCEECYESFSEAVSIGSDVKVRANAPATTGKTVWAIAKFAAAAALISVAWLGWRGMFPSPERQSVLELATLASAASNWRTTGGRLSAPSPWTELNSVERSPGGTEPPLAVQVSAAKLRLLAEQHPGAETLRAAGIAELLLRRNDEAVTALSEAVRLDPSSAEGHIDLTAALLERSAARNSHFDATRALSQAEIASRLAPQDRRAAFNLALALEASKLVERAKKAWHRYLELDTDAASGWAREARARLSQLEAQKEQTYRAAHPEAWTTADLTTLARDFPGDLLTFISRSGLPGWAAAVRSHEAFDFDLAVNAAHALSAAGHASSDAYLIDAAIQAATWSEPRRRCLADALSALGEWERAPLRDPQSVATAQRIRSGLACARVAPRAAQLRYARSLFFTGKRALGLAEAATLDSSSQQVSAAVLQMRGLDSLVASRMSAAQDDLVESARLAAAAGDAELVVSNAAYLAEMFDEQGDHETAWRYLATGLDASHGAEVTGRNDVVSTAAVAAAHNGLAGAAFHFSDELVDSGGKADARMRLIGHLQRGRAREALQDHAGAIADLALARADVADFPSPSARAAWQSEVDWIEGLVFATADPARAERGLSAAVAHAARTNRRFRLAELLLFRGRSYQRLNRPGDALADFERGAAIVEDQRAQIRDEQLRISRTAEVWELFGELIDGAPTDAEALIAAERARARELLNRLTPETASRPTLAALQSAVPAGGVALEYAVRPDQLWTWTLTRDRVSLVKTKITRARLTALVSACRRELWGGGPGKATRELARIILPPGAVTGRDQFVVIVPDGPLHGVPFAALELSDAVPLVLRTVPVVTPSLASFAETSSRAVDAAQMDALLVGIGQSFPALDLPALASVDREIAALSGIYTRRTILDDRTGTPGAVLSAMPNYSVIHVASHSKVDLDVPAHSRLFVAAESGRFAISADDITGIRLRPGAIVVLAACDTAAGRTFAGEGSLGFVRPFLAAGAAAVVGVLWPIDDGTATAILVELHSGIRNGVGTARALASAQRSAINAGLAPRFWAGYQVTGGAPPTPRSK